MRVEAVHLYDSPRPKFPTLGARRCGDCARGLPGAVRAVALAAMRARAGSYPICDACHQKRWEEHRRASL